MFKGEIMRKQFLRFLFVLIGVAGSGIAAKAQDVDQVVVKIPYAFVVGDKTLRAGSYRVDRLIGSNDRELVLSNLDNHASTLVVAAVLESNSSDKAGVSFEHVGDQFFLSEIKSAGHVFTIPVSRSAVLEAIAKSHGGTSGSESAAGSN
jgi:hypothetical protein